MQASLFGCNLIVVAIFKQQPYNLATNMLSNVDENIAYQQVTNDIKVKVIYKFKLDHSCIYFILEYNCSIKKM